MLALEFFGPIKQRRGAANLRSTTASAGDAAVVPSVRTGVCAVKRSGRQLIQVTKAMAGSMDRAYAVASRLVALANAGYSPEELARRKKELLADAALEVPHLGLDDQSQTFGSNREAAAAQASDHSGGAMASTAPALAPHRQALAAPALSWESEANRKLPQLEEFMVAEAGWRTGGFVAVRPGGHEAGWRTGDFVAVRPGGHEMCSDGIASAAEAANGGVATSGLPQHANPRVKKRFDVEADVTTRSSLFSLSSSQLRSDNVAPAADTAYEGFGSRHTDSSGKCQHSDVEASKEDVVGAKRRRLNSEDDEDVPLGHIAHDKVKYCNHPQGDLYFFVYGSEHFQVTVGRACNSHQHAARVARLCFRRFQQGESKEAVKAFRDETLKRLAAQWGALDAQHHRGFSGAHVVEAIPGVGKGTSKAGGISTSWTSQLGSRFSRMRSYVDPLDM